MTDWLAAELTHGADSRLACGEGTYIYTSFSLFLYSFARNFYTVSVQFVNGQSCDPSSC